MEQRHPRYETKAHMWRAVLGGAIRQVVPVDDTNVLFRDLLDKLDR